MDPLETWDHRANCYSKIRDRQMEWQWTSAHFERSHWAMNWQEHLMVISTNCWLLIVDYHENQKLLGALPEWGRGCAHFYRFTSWNLPGCPSKVPRKITSCLWKKKGESIHFEVQQDKFPLGKLTLQVTLLGTVTQFQPSSLAFLTYVRRGRGRGG